MKRLFKQFLIQFKINLNEIDRKNHYGKLTDLFNKWIGGYKDKKLKIRRFRFNAYANKFMIRKWVQKTL